jgi:hypothetical protein
MPYRYWLHWYTDPDAPLNAGRALPDRTLAEAIAHANEILDEGAYASSNGCCLVDTEDGTIARRGERDPSPSQQRRHNT